MIAFAIIGWAFIGGCAVAAFIVPIYALDALFRSCFGTGKARNEEG